MSTIVIAGCGDIGRRIADLAARDGIPVTGLVRSIEENAAAAGWMEIVWNGRTDQGQAAPSGIYFMRAQAGSLSETVRAVLLK